MALKFTIPFPIFAPPSSQPQRPATELRFSRWNNANAEKFNAPKRAQQEIEDDIRRHRRFDSADNIVNNYDDSTTTTTTETFKSIGTPSSPSKPSIPGKSSKYSKDPDSHPAFRSSRRTTKVNRVPARTGTASLTEDGVTYRVEGAPFEFSYSYTETPKAKPIALREAPFSPFGPVTMSRPWTGRAPLPPSKKKLKEFDSFQLPPPHKKGVKSVQKPGPYLPGSGPKYVRSREEILGEPLTQEEIKELVQSCLRTNRQLNMGRDGLTHNMLDNIHAHWKRRRVCKIKCKGVCTVDMDNVRHQLEEKSGGKIIYSKGGVLFLFRGRNYNYKTRPRFPLMLWKPVTPVYPRLVKQAPEGLTLEEAGEMRKKGRKLIPICKLGKNGVYSDLVRHVKEAFQVCELVRINCQGMNPSDYRKIGGKLKELVPCVLISFENEHILMWRGKSWNSSLSNPEDDTKGARESETDGATLIVPPLEEQELSASYVSEISVNGTSLVIPSNPEEDAKEAWESKTDGAILIVPPLEGKEVPASCVSEISVNSASFGTLSNPEDDAKEARKSETDGATLMVPPLEGHKLSTSCVSEISVGTGGTLSNPEDDAKESQEFENDGAILIVPPLEGKEVPASCVSEISVNSASFGTLSNPKDDANEARKSETDGATLMVPPLEGHKLSTSCVSEISVGTGGTLSNPEDDAKESQEFENDGATLVAPPFEGQELSTSCISDISFTGTSLCTLDTITLPMSSKDTAKVESENVSPEVNEEPLTGASTILYATNTNEIKTISDNSDSYNTESVPKNTNGSEKILADTGHGDEDPGRTENQLGPDCTHEELKDVSDTLQNPSEPARLTSPCTDRVLQLWKQALESGSAVILDDSSSNADIVYERAVAFAQTAPPDPVFRRYRHRKAVAVQKLEKQETNEVLEKEVMSFSETAGNKMKSTRIPEMTGSERKFTRVPERAGSEKKSTRIRRVKDFKEELANLDVVPRGTLKVDELAKLLA